MDNYNTKMIFENDIDIDNMIDDEVDEEEFVEPKKWTIITAMNRVLDIANCCGLSDELWKMCRRPVDYLKEVLGLTEVQLVILAILIESGEAMTWRNIAKQLKCSRLSMMVYAEEMEGLVENQWIRRATRYECCDRREGFMVEAGVVKALRHNKVFQPEKLNGLQIKEFMDKVERYVDRYHGNIMEFEDVENWLVCMCKANHHLPLCRKVLRYNDLHVQSLLMMIVYDYAQWADSDDEGLSMGAIDESFPEEYDTNYMRHALREGTHQLIVDGLIEHKCEDGLANEERYMLTRQFKDEVLGDYEPSRSRCFTHHGTADQRLTDHNKIKTKTMYYNSSEQVEVDRLTKMLSQDSLSDIQQRLDDEGMRKGFACLFYGGPGTGKTETVLQIARETGRDIMQIDIAGMRDKYVGESEKNIKAVFNRYREVCKKSEVMPILFFNEADGIFGKRSNIGGTNPSVEKMDNSMQNIILQEMENLDGILIATTNLTCNLDSAFERRFLFKIEFHKPDEVVKAKLWKSMLGDNITEEDAQRLAMRYDFSGGQIENIARKRTIEYILTGKKASFDEINEFCRHEFLNTKSDRRSIGFCA